MIYKIIKCSNCKNYNITSSKSSLKCKYCNKNINLFNKKIYFSSENPTLVSKVLIKIKEEKFKNNYLNIGEDNFFNYKLDD